MQSRVLAIEADCSLGTVLDLYHYTAMAHLKTFYWSNFDPKYAF